MRCRWERLNESAFHCDWRSTTPRLDSNWIPAWSFGQLGRLASGDHATASVHRRTLGTLTLLIIIGIVASLLLMRIRNRNAIIEWQGSSVDVRKLLIVVSLIGICATPAFGLLGRRRDRTYRSRGNCLTSCGSINDSWCGKRKFHRYHVCAGTSTTDKCTMTGGDQCIWENYSPEAPGSCTCDPLFSTGTSNGAPFTVSTLTPCND
jgi:hypothetical protein